MLPVCLSPLKPLHLNEPSQLTWCSRKGGPLAVTDANLMLGRLLPEYFPKIFGKSEKEPLDREASRGAFEKVAKEINEGSSQDRELGLDEIVYGCVAAQSSCSN